MPRSIHELQAGGRRADAAGPVAPHVLLPARTGRAGEIRGEATTAGHVGASVAWCWRWGASANTAIGACTFTFTDKVLGSASESGSGS